MQAADPSGTIVRMRFRTAVVVLVMMAAAGLLGWTLVKLLVSPEPTPIGPVFLDVSEDGPPTKPAKKGAAKEKAKADEGRDPAGSSGGGSGGAEPAPPPPPPPAGDNDDDGNDDDGDDGDD
jgi:hypothetical protein